MRKTQRVQAKLNLVRLNYLLRFFTRMTSKDILTPTTVRLFLSTGALQFMACFTVNMEASAQTVSLNQPAPDHAGWQQCMGLRSDSVARLQCFDQWAQQQDKPPPTPPVAPVASAAPIVLTMVAPEAHNCKNPKFSELSRYWELEAGSDCGTFGINAMYACAMSCAFSPAGAATVVEVEVTMSWDDRGGNMVSVKVPTALSKYDL